MIMGVLNYKNTSGENSMRPWDNPGVIGVDTGLKYYSTYSGLQVVNSKMFDNLSSIKLMSSDGPIISTKKNKNMSSDTGRFYKVIKETPAWDVGAIIKHDGSDGYVALNDLFNKEHTGRGYFESGTIIENSPEWFERVYPVSLVTKTVYKAKAEAREMFSKETSA